MASPLILALGGTRSGKSRFGLAAATRLAGDGRAWFLATAWPGDPELDDRIARHRPSARPRGRRSRSARTSRPRSPQTEPDEPVADRRPDALAQHAPRRRRPRRSTRCSTAPSPPALAAIAARPGPVDRRQRRGRLAGSCRCMPAPGPIATSSGSPTSGWRRMADEVHLLVAGLPITLKGRRRHDRPTPTTFPAPGSSTAALADLGALRPLDADAMAAARGPPRSTDQAAGQSWAVSRTIVIQLAGHHRAAADARRQRRAIVVAAADHGVARRASRPIRPT